jgi:hypothetical protein
MYTFKLCVTCFFLPQPLLFLVFVFLMNKPLPLLRVWICSSSIILLRWNSNQRKKKDKMVNKQKEEWENSWICEVVVKDFVERICSSSSRKGLHGLMGRPDKFSYLFYKNWQIFFEKNSMDNKATYVSYKLVVIIFFFK